MHAARQPIRPSTPQQGTTANGGVSPGVASIRGGDGGTTKDAAASIGGSNREEIFQRIMRKLQHQTNYSDGNAASLTQQVLGASVSSPTTVPMRDATTPQPPQESRSGSRQPGALLQPGVRVSQRPHHDDEHDLKGTRAASNNNASLPAASRGIKELDDEEERKFGMQPCPPTMRLVLDYVRETIAGKLDLAHVGSLWESMRCIYESRTMLDKLLKEITQHSHYQEGSGGSTATTEQQALGSGGNKVQELYQELRKIPVVLPQTHYAQEQTTGKFGAVLRHPEERNDLAGGGSFETGFVPARSPVPPFPPGHRVAHGGGGGRSTAGGTTLTSPTFPRPGGGGAATTNKAMSGSMVQTHPEHFVHTAMTAKDRRDHELLMRHLRRKTQLVECGMQTEESTLTIVLKEQYTALGKHCGDLEMELENKKGAIKQLTANLTQVKQQLEEKARVVQYIRGTLFKETVMLRQQLATAQQRQLMMQQQQQLLSQQMLASVAAVGNNSSSVGAVSNNSMSTSAGGGASPHYLPQTALGSPSSTNGGGGGLDDAFDVTSISSLIDLALLGVEKNRSLNHSSKEIVRIAAASSGGLISGSAASPVAGGHGSPRGDVSPSSSPAGSGASDPLLLPNAETQVVRLKEDLQLRSMKWKRELAAMRSKFAIVVNEKNKQIKSIQLATDVKNLRSILLSQISSVRQDYSALRKGVRASLSDMRNNMLSGLAEVEYSIKLIADAIDVSTEKSRVVAVQKELLRACGELFGPMLSLDYALGAHRWLQRHRTGDPLLHALQMKFTPDVIGIVGRELEAMHLVYQGLQRFVLHHYQTPRMSHTQVGQPLVTLIWMLISDPGCNGELLQQLRTALQIEYDLNKKLARLNFKIKVTTWKQQMAQDIAVKALKEMGMDTHQAGAAATASGPTQKVLNRLSMQVTTLQTLKADANRQRMSNAKEVQRIWRESTLDPFRGRKAPKIREPVVLSVNAAPLVSPVTKSRSSTADARAPTPSFTQSETA